MKIPIYRQLHNSNKILVLITHVCFKYTYTLRYIVAKPTNNTKNNPSRKLFDDDTSYNIKYIHKISYFFDHFGAPFSTTLISNLIVIIVYSLFLSLFAYLYTPQHISPH